MSNYDRFAISSKPEFYFSSNSSSDQSGTSLYGITNGASNIGQPIIAGNPSSWRVAYGESLELDANPIFFRKESTLEFVIQRLQPINTVCIFGDDDEFNGIFLNPTGVQVRFVDSDLNQRSASLTFSNWPEKMHIVLNFDSVYCSLRVNDIFSQVSYRETDPTSITQVSFKTNSQNTYYIDGIGVYTGTFEPKSQYIDVEQFNYLDFINKTYAGAGTVFDGYRGLSKIQISKSQFKPDPLQSETYIYTQTFPMSSDEDFSSICIESNYQDIEMQYSTNTSSWIDFTGHISFVPDADFFLLQLRVKVEYIDRSFIINVFPLFDDRIMTKTPTQLTPNGGPLYPETHSLSMVNFPDGVELYNISYEGEWIEYIPNSIEIVFMPKTTTKTIIFDSTDGSASCGTGGSITGFTAYLNGASVANLNNVRVNQWNHLVLTKVSTASDTFYLNSNSSRTEQNIIEYALLTSYPSVLSSDICSQLYSILFSYHRASVSDDPSNIAEGELDGTSPFKAYSFAWAIVGGGGK